jgi:hypothetical protein
MAGQKLGQSHRGAMVLSSPGTAQAIPLRRLSPPNWYLVMSHFDRRILFVIFWIAFVVIAAVVIADYVGMGAK